MTNERARTELEQLYMSLSEEKKKALDVAFKAMEQADNIPVMYYPQVDGITPTVVAQADGEYIPKQAVLENIDQWYEDKADIEDLIVKITYMPSVAIPPEHDGCKDCVYQDNPQDAMPCRECKQNYMDKWKAIPSAYKGMTNGEVMHKLFPNTPFVIGDIGISVKWWNSPYEPQESEVNNG